MSKLEEIYSGWKNLITDEFKETAEERAKICAVCPKNILNVCSSCGCPLSAKTRSPNTKCPENLWIK